MSTAPTTFESSPFIVPEPAETAKSEVEPQPLKAVNVGEIPENEHGENLVFYDPNRRLIGAARVVRGSNSPEVVNTMYRNDHSALSVERVLTTSDHYDDCYIATLEHLTEVASKPENVDIHTVLGPSTNSREVFERYTGSLSELPPGWRLQYAYSDGGSFFGYPVGFIDNHYVALRHISNGGKATILIVRTPQT